MVHCCIVCVHVYVCLDMKVWFKLGSQMSLPPLVRRLFFGVNEIAVKVPSVFKLLIKEVGPSLN